MSRTLLLAADADPAACAELYRLFRDATPEATAACSTSNEHTQLGSGIALSSRDAATCLLDAPRTNAMLRGTLNAIREASARFHGPIEVVYAGTGPFAPFALLSAHLLDPQTVRFTLIDIDPVSTASVESLVRHFGVEAFVRAVVCTDATTYQHPDPIHVVISETMQRALGREPFVSILRNLRPQLVAGGVVVPESVSIDLGLIEAATSATTTVATVFEVTRRGESSVTVPVTVAPSKVNAQWVALLTRIQTFGGETLRSHESGLTTPEILWRLSPLTRSVTLELRYEAGADPGIRWRELA